MATETVRAAKPSPSISTVNDASTHAQACSAIRTCSCRMWSASGSTPDAVAPEEVELIARNCPSGAIRYEYNDGTHSEPAPVVNLVHIRENGPPAFNAPLLIAGIDEGMRATLCRCGESHNKPFCDHRHVECGFIATGEPVEKIRSIAPARWPATGKSNQERPAARDRQSRSGQRHRPYHRPPH